MKKNKKLLDEKYDVKNSPFVTKLIWVIAGIFVFIFLLLLLGTFLPKLAVFLWYYFLVPFNAFLFFLGQYCSITILDKTIDSYFVFFFVLVLLFLAESLITFTKSISMNFKYKFINRLRCIYYPIGAFLILSIIIGIVFTFNHPTMSHLYFPDQEEKNYTLEDIDDLSQLLSNKVLEYSNSFDRDEDGNIIYYGSLEEQAIHDLKKISLKYPFLKGYYPKKIYSFSKKEKQEDPSTLGLTFISTVKVDYRYLTTSDTLNTITHEYCHTKGITRENEASFCSIVAGIESENPLSQYAAYVEAYGRMLHAYREIDQIKALELEDKVVSRCLEDGYRELCNFYLNDLYTDFYVKDSDKIYIRTYLLNHYSYAEIENLIYNLKSENINLKVSMRNEKIALKDLKTVFYQYPDQYLMIEVDNSSKIFEKIQPILVQNKDRYISIVQDYPNRYTGVQMSPEEAIQYYTKPTPSSNLFTSFGKQFDDAYDYSRTVRLLLEYYD